MSGPAIRAIAALGTYGASELGQKKPFQNFGKDQPTSKLAGGPLRLAGVAATPLTVGTGAPLIAGQAAAASAGASLPVLGSVANSMKPPPLPSFNLPLASVNDKPVDPSALRRRRSFSTILTGASGVAEDIPTYHPSLLGTGAGRSTLG